VSLLTSLGIPPVYVYGCRLPLPGLPFFANTFNGNGTDGLFTEVKNTSIGSTGNETVSDGKNLKV